MIRELNSLWKNIVVLLSAGMVIFQIGVLGFTSLDTWIARAIYFQLITILGLILYKRSPKASHDRPDFIDFAFIAMALTSWVYLVVNYDALVWRIPISTNTVDAIMGLLLVLSVLELVRRAQGLGIMLLGTVFIIYSLFGDMIPLGILSHNGYSFNRIFGTYYSSYGVYGTIMGITATYIFIFVVFGAMLSSTGIGDYFLTLSNYIAGKTRGGAAKIAVIASGLFGTVSGSGAANAVATGSITIPMMKKKGYDKIFAATVESMASTGGQICPPVMGAGAFLMAELIGVSYNHIILAALIPAILFYTVTFTVIDFYSAKHGYKGLLASERPERSRILSEIYLLLPLAVLIFCLLGPKYSIVRVGYLSALACVAVSFVNRKNWLNAEKIKATIYDIAKNMVGITALTAVAGIVVATLSLTGLAMNISRLLISISAGNIGLALLFTMMVTVVLGMGMPTTAAYIIAASVLAPALIQLGFTALVAHLFIFYFACLSCITPPVAVVSYATATIAEADPMKVAMATLKLSLGLFLIPFLFAYEPSLLFEGGIGLILYNFVRCIIATFLLSGSVVGWWMQLKINMKTRCILFITAMILFLNLGVIVNLAALVLVVLSVKFPNFERKTAVENND